MSSLEQRPVFAGIDLTAGKRPVDFALLDEKLQLLDLSTRPLDEVLHEVETHAQIAVAVDAPARVSAGLLSRPQVRRQLGLTDGSARWANHRVAEYELRRRGLNLYVTPRSQSKAPAWMRQGFAAYRRLSASGFALGAQEVPPLRWAFEVYPHASFAGLLGHVPFPKAALEGRVQRQLVLYREGLQVTDPLLALEELTAHHLLAGRLELDGLLDHDALDALVAAFTAWLAWVRPERVTWVGHPADGHICVAGAFLADRYVR